MLLMLATALGGELLAIHSPRLRLAISTGCAIALSLEIIFNKVVLALL